MRQRDGKLWPEDITVTQSTGWCEAVTSLQGGRRRIAERSSGLSKSKAEMSRNRHFPLPLVTLRQRFSGRIFSLLYYNIPLCLSHTHTNTPMFANLLPS
jgi:hypothetical protein